MKWPLIVFAYIILFGPGVFADDANDLAQVLQKSSEQIGNTGNQIMQRQQSNQGNNMDFACLSQCQAQGTMLGLCQKRCSY